MRRFDTAPVGPSEWNADVYHRVSDPQFEWATEVLERLPLRGDEVVLDAGCGTGRVTALLVDRLPRGRVIGVDASQSMVEKARETLGERAEVRRGSLTDLELDREVDAVFSNAVFHWIPDHDQLFRSVHDALKSGGRLIAQCGGAENLDTLYGRARALMRSPEYRDHFGGWTDFNHFENVADTERRLRHAGFNDIDV